MGFRILALSQDEGQHLQTVFRRNPGWEGPGKFAFTQGGSSHRRRSPRVSDETRERLSEEWSRYWDLTKPVLLEKSPPNLIRTRFFAALFPNSVFVNILRHPVAVAYATKKWNKAPLASRFRHWLHAHQDSRSRTCRDSERQSCVRYEEFVRAPQAVVDRVWTFLGLPPGPAVRGVLGEANGTCSLAGSRVTRSRGRVGRFWCTGSSRRCVRSGTAYASWTCWSCAGVGGGRQRPSRQSRLRTGRRVKVRVGLGRGHGPPVVRPGTEREVWKAAEIASALDQLLPQTLCEMQCGTGEIISFLAARYGAEATGYDTSPEAIGLARERRDPARSLLRR